MTPRFAELRSEVETLEADLREARLTLRIAEAACRHDWGEAKYTPKIREAYTEPGDPVGTMGVDWRGPVYVQREEKPLWTRTCKICGTSEVTNLTTEKVQSIPRF